MSVATIFIILRDCFSSSSSKTKKTMLTFTEKKPKVSSALWLLKILSVDRCLRVLTGTVTF